VRELLRLFVFSKTCINSVSAHSLPVSVCHFRILKLETPGAVPLSNKDLGLSPRKLLKSCLSQMNFGAFWAILMPVSLSTARISLCRLLQGWRNTLNCWSGFSLHFTVHGPLNFLIQLPDGLSCPLNSDYYDNILFHVDHFVFIFSFYPSPIIFRFE